MATVRKVDLTEQCFNDSVFKKPPLPSRPTSGKFQIRGSGKIFRNTCQNDLFSQSDSESSTSRTTRNLKPSTDNTDDSLALVLHPDFKAESPPSSLKREKAEPRHRRQTKSAKARINHNPNNSTQARTRQRPSSAGSALTRTKVSMNGHSERVPIIDLCNKVIPDLFEIEKERLLALPEPKHDSIYKGDHPPPMHFTRPFSAHFEQESNEKCFCKRDGLPKKVAKGLKPSVYGLQHNRHVYGSAPDLTSVKDSDLEKSPYKLATPEAAEEKSASKDSSGTEIPHTLEPLLPWLNKDVPPEDVLGVDPGTCLVFLPPCLDWSELPEVPDLQEAEADLPFLEDITTPRPWKPKKYPHPFFENKSTVDEWVCNHRPTAPEPGDGDWHTVYRKTIKMPRMRTAEVVRKEIGDLENLMKGVGTHNSDCAMCQYQSEIADFQDAMRVTMDMVPDRLKNPAPPVDTFGLKKVFKDHDDFMDQVCQKMIACRAELADLELEAGIASDRQYFRKRSNSIL